MEIKNEEKSNMFNRILQILENEGYRSLRDFAINGLGYTGSEKLNRLKKEGAAPSIDIILDISNKFDNVSLDWLIAGRGEMIRTTNIVQGDRNSVSNNTGTITARNVGDNSINISAPKEGTQKIIHPDGKIEIVQSTQDLSSVAEPQASYVNKDAMLKEKQKEIDALRSQVISLQAELIDRLKSDK